jgi:hypothetical protein
MWVGFFEQQSIDWGGEGGSPHSHHLCVVVTFEHDTDNDITTIIIATRI